MRPCPICHHHHIHLKIHFEHYKIVKCKHCGFIYLANPSPIENEQQNYEEYFHNSAPGDYSQSSTDSQMRKAWHRNEQRLRWISRFVPQGRLLDIGCGRGYFLSHARQKNYNVEGIEISIAAAFYASEKYGLRIHVQNIEQEATPDERFDAITLWHVLEHFHDPRAVLEKLKPLLNVNGCLFIEVPNFNNLKSKLQNGRKQWQGGNHPKYHRSFFTRETLNRALRSTGFRHIRAAHLVYHSAHPLPVRMARQLLQYIQRDSFLISVAWF